MARQAREVQIAALYTQRGQRSAWVRTSETTAVPSLIDAEIHVIDPQVIVRLLIDVADDGRPRVRELHLEPSSIRDSVTTTMLRKLPIDELVRRSLERATRTDVTPRPDIDPNAYQVGGDPEYQAWIGPKPDAGGRGRAVPNDRVRRAAEIYQQAVMNGDKAPTEAVAKALGYSRPTAARDVRAAREQGILPATPSMIDQAEQTAARDLVAEAETSTRRVWRSVDPAGGWDPMDTWMSKVNDRLNNPEILLREAISGATALGAKDPQAVGEAAVRARNDPAERDYPRRTGLGPSDLHLTALVLYGRTVGAELASRTADGQDEDAALARIVAEIRAKLDELDQ